MYNNNPNINNNDNGMQRIPNRIFVGGLPQNATDDEFRDYFSHFGPVKDARIIKNYRGISKGFGFITYVNENDASKVLSLKEEELAFKENKLNIGYTFRKKNFSNNFNNNHQSNNMRGSHNYQQQHHMMGGNSNNNIGLSHIGGGMPTGFSNLGSNSYLDNQMHRMNNMGGFGSSTGTGGAINHNQMGYGAHLGVMNNMNAMGGMNIN